MEGIEDPAKLPTVADCELRIADCGLNTPEVAPAEIPNGSPAASGVEGSVQEIRNPQSAIRGSTELAEVNPEVAAGVKAVMDRLETEMKVIEKTGFISYFLITGDFVRYGRSKGVTCVARGSAAGSIVTYLLEISNVDPIRYGLLFERFLNPERVNPPDIDIDFADDRRGDVIEYVRRKIWARFGGADHHLWHDGREVGHPRRGPRHGPELRGVRPAGENDPQRIEDDAEKGAGNIAGLQSRPTRTEEQTRELMDTAFVLEDLTRNASVHAAGVVIGDQPLVNLLPLKKDEDGAIVTQYAMGPVGDLGLLKMDFLGLKTLTVIRNTCELVRRCQGVEIPIDNLPLDDAKTYDLLNKANTIGIFQLESGGMRDLCRKFQISSVEHITALVALYRPGPMELIPDFIKRRHGEVKIEYEHPLLEPIDARDLRRADLPGTSDAGRAGAGRLHAGRRRLAAPGHGQEEAGGNGPAAGDVRQGLRQSQ